MSTIHKLCRVLTFELADLMEWLPDDPTEP